MWPLAEAEAEATAAADSPLGWLRLSTLFSALACLALAILALLAITAQHKLNELSCTPADNNQFLPHAQAKHCASNRRLRWQDVAKESISAGIKKVLWGKAHARSHEQCRRRWSKFHSSTSPFRPCMGQCLPAALLPAHRYLTLRS